MRKGQTINAEYCSSLLVQLKDILKEKPRGKVTKVALFLHDNVPAHRALAIQTKLAFLGFQCLNHPSYSPDLAPWTEKTIERWPFYIHTHTHIYALPGSGTPAQLTVATLCSIVLSRRLLFELPEQSTTLQVFSGLSDNF
jgi:hypothetical protein